MFLLTIGQYGAMSSYTYSFASLFSGGGGFDLGFMAEGFSPRAAFDSDKYAVENYRSNVDCTIECVDLTEKRPSGDGLRNLDVLIAGPPCQGFSTAGKRDFGDKRNHLLPLTGEIALSLHPKVLVVENVFGSLAGEHAQYFMKLQSMLADHRYQTAFLRCQAANLGMAQLRRRVLFFAWRTKWRGQLSPPQGEPMSIREALRGISGMPNHEPRWLPAGSADARIASRIKPGQKLSNVRSSDRAVPTWKVPEVFGEVTADECTLLEMLRRLRRQERKREYGDADPVSLERLEVALGNPFCRLLNGLIAKGYVRRKGNDYDLTGTFNGKYRRLAWEEPSCTVDTRFGSPRYFLHPSVNRGRHRGFTVREAARLQGFSDTYRFSGPLVAQYRVIGNAVPPPLGQFAARICRRILGGDV